MSDPGTKPSADDFFGQKPTADEFFAPPPPSLMDSAGTAALDTVDPMGILRTEGKAALGLAHGSLPQSSAALDNYIKNTPAGRILHAFGQGAAQGWGTEPLGFSPESEQTLRNAGVFNDYNAGRTNLIRSFNEAFMRPAAAGVDAAVRGLNAAAGGAEQAAAQSGLEAEQTPIGHAVGAGELGRTAAGFIEYEFQRGDINLRPFTGVPPEIAKARNLGVIGEGEDGYFGTKEPTPESAADRGAAARAASERETEAREEGGQADATGTGFPPPPAEAPAPDVHTVARDLAPETFREYDALDAERGSMRSLLNSAAEDRERDPRVVAAQDEINTILGKVDGIEDRLTKKAAARLEDIRGGLEDFLSTDTEDMARIRQDMQKLDYRMRDLAPDVAKAYRMASEQMPPEAPPEAAPEARQQAESPSAPESVPAPETAPQQPRVVPVDQIPIAGDIERKLMAAGRPQDEAKAAGDLTQAYYETRAARFGGAKGTAADLYRAEAPDIIAGKTRARAMAQSGGKTLHQSASAPIFRSSLTESIRALKQDRAPAEQWSGILDNLRNKGVKQEEIDWSGVKDWLASRSGPIRKADLLDYLRANEVHVQEVERGAATTTPEEQRALDGALAGAVRRGDMTDLDAARFGQRIRRGDADTIGDAEQLGVPDDVLAPFRDQKGGPTKFGSYTLPGGKNYRELLLTLPEKSAPVGPRPEHLEALPEGWEVSYDRTAPGDRRYSVIPAGQAHGRPYMGRSFATPEHATANAINNLNMERLHKWKQGQEVPAFRSGHFDEPNVLAHVRFDDRTGPNGERILHMAEVQSDWHQKGRREGYIKDRPQFWVRNTRSENASPFFDTLAEADAYRNALPESVRVQTVISKRPRRIGNIPDAPFKTTWPELAMKRMLRYAAEHGYDKLTWDTGATQADRYDLSHHLDRIEYEPAGDGKFEVHAFDHSGKKVIEEDEVGLDRVEELFGKDIAKRIEDGHGDRVHGNLREWRALSGLDLKVGGEGMRGFYDKILPAFLNKYAKKWGARVENDTVPKAETKSRDEFSTQHMRAWPNTPPDHLDAAYENYRSQVANAPAHSIAITPAMRESVMQGQPLFQGRRGSITINNARNTIKLFKSADASTFIHESGHQWLEDLMQDAGDEQAPADLKQDAQTVRSWLGVNDGDPIPTKAHEKFARGFERYMMEGIAPSRELAGVFAKFKQWLTQIYQTVQRLRAPISDDIRAVFDRMLSTAPEKIVTAPEREPVASLADEHERLAAETAPEQAPQVAEKIRTEIDAKARDIAPQVAEELHNAGPSDEASGEPGADAGVASSSDASRPVAADAGGAERTGALAEGGNAPEAQGAGPRSKVERLHEPVPRAPMRLVDFIKAHGGIRDTGGDVANSIGGPKGRPGLIRKNGRTADDLALLAWESGYFPESQERPSVNDLLVKIDEDVRGDNPQYSDHDRQQLNDYEAAVGRNREIDELSDRLGIDTAGISRAEFWAKVSEHMSLEELHRDAESYAAAFEHEMAEAERRAKEAVEALGDSWEPSDPYIAGRPRSLEELEHEREAENAAARASDRARGPEASGPSAVGAGPIQENSGPGGDGAGNAGRDADAVAARDNAASPAEPEPADQPANPNQRLGRPDAGLIDKAGNIRLDNLSTPEDVSEVIRKVAGENDAFMQARRGVLTDGEVLDLSEAIGMDAATLDRRKIGQAFNAEQIVAARKLLITSAKAVRDAMATAAGGDDVASLIAYAEAKDRHRMIQEQVAGITAEAGRALRAFRKLPGMEDAAAIGDFIKDATGRTLNQLRIEAKLGSALQTPAQVSRFAWSTGGERFKSMVLEYYVNALISGPVTHFRYSVGNAINALWGASIEAPLAAGVGAVRDVLGLVSDGDRAYLGEAGAQLLALTKGSRDGWSAGYQALRTGVSPMLPGERFSENFSAQRAIPGPIGAVLTTPSRVVSGIHSFFKAIRYEQFNQSFAYRQATREGLTGKAFSDRVADLTLTPTTEMMEAWEGRESYDELETMLAARDQARSEGRYGEALDARIRELVAAPTPEMKAAIDSGAHTETARIIAENSVAATRESLRELYLAPAEYDSASALLARAVNRSVLFKIMAPFIKIGLQIARNAFIERTPLGFVDRNVRDNLLGKNGGGAQDAQWGKVVAGTSLMGITFMLAAEGYATGDGPEDPAERHRWLLSHKPNTVTVGDISVPYQGLGSLGMLMRFSANTYQVAHSLSDETGEKVAWAAVEGLSKAVMDENFMRGVKDALDAIYHPQEYGASYIKQFATNWLPFSVGMSQISRQIDPYQRATKTGEFWSDLWNTVKDRTPFVSESLPPRRDVFGEPIPNSGQVQDYRNDPTVQTLDRLNIGIGNLSAKIRGVQLTPEQYDDYSRISGRFAKVQLDAMVRMPGFADLPATVQIEMIHKAVSEARENARSLMLMTSPTLLRQAIAAKQAAATGIAP